MEKRIRFDRARDAAVAFKAAAGAFGAMAPQHIDVELLAAAIDTGRRTAVAVVLAQAADAAWASEDAFPGLPAPAVFTASGGRGGVADGFGSGRSYVRCLGREIEFGVYDGCQDDDDAWESAAVRRDAAIAAVGDAEVDYRW